MAVTVTDILNQWNQIGVFSYVIPFLLIFAVIFAILQKTKILTGEHENKGLLAIISIAVSLLALQFDMVSIFFAVIFPRFGIGLSIFLVLLILLGFFYDGTGFVAATLSDDRGHFELTVDHGDYFALILPARGRELGMVHPIDIAERQETTVVLPFYKSFHEIYGQIKTEADIPRGDATLLFYCETTGAVMQSRTANSGSYHLRLPAGTYQAKVGLLSPVHGFYRVYDLDSVHLDRDRRFDIELGTTSIEDTEEVQEADVRPQWTELEQNYPNPFNPTTTIRYQIEESAQVELKVYDILGRAVATLVSARQPSGMHRARWHGRDVTGHPVASGVYLYRLTVENGTRLFTDTKKLLLVR